MEVKSDSAAALLGGREGRREHAWVARLQSALQLPSHAAQAGLLLHASRMRAGDALFFFSPVSPKDVSSLAFKESTFVKQI